MARKVRHRHARRNSVHSSLAPAQNPTGSLEDKRQESRSTDNRTGSSADKRNTVAASERQHDASASKGRKRRRMELDNWCRKCRTKSTSRWRTGPDGLRTLCSRCAFSYAEMNLTLFRDKDGNISATNKEGSNAVAVIGFEMHPDGKRNLLRPVVAPLLPTAVEPEAEQDAGNDAREDPKQDESQWCRKCGARESSRWRTGPDGFKTLCTPCSKRYVRHQLVLFQSEDGCVSAEAKPGWKPVAVTGFQTSEKDNTRILSTPDVRPMTITEVSTSPDTCIEYVPAPPSQAVISPQQSESRTSPSISLNIARQDDATRNEGEGPAPKVENKLLLSETSRTLHWVIDANENEACEALLDLERNHTGVRKTAKAEPDTGNGPKTYSVKACFKSEEGVFLVRRFTISNGLVYENFADQIRELFKLTGSLDITYEDDEGDNVTVSSNLELEVMMTIARSNSISPIRVTVTSGSQM